MVISTHVEYTQNVGKIHNGRNISASGGFPDPLNIDTQLSNIMVVMRSWNVVF